MLTRIRIHTLVSLLLTLALVSPSAALAVEQLDLQMVLKRINATYPTLKIAARQVEKSRQDMIATQSQLGWNLAAQGGFDHDVNMLGTGIADTTSFGVNLNKQLERGDNITVGTNYSLAPNLFGAGDTTALDFEVAYRMPLLKGQGNSTYQFALTSSRAAIMMSEANEQIVREQLANQVVEIYFAAAQLIAQLDRADESVDRAKRSLSFTEKNLRMGLAESRDILVAKAQLRAAQLDVNNSKRMWVKQRTTLNRLMGMPWDNEFVVRLPKKPELDNASSEIIEEIVQTSPMVKLNTAKKMIAEATIDKALDDKKSKFDLVVSVGQKSRNGTDGTSGGIQFEYQMPIDGSGFDARLYQARIEKDIAEDNLNQSRDEVRYNAQSLLSEINYSHDVLARASSSLNIQRQRYEEVKQRFDRGRADTSQILMIEGELALGKFSLQQQQIELARRITQLQVMRGTFWSAVTGHGE